MKKEPLAFSVRRTALALLVRLEETDGFANLLLSDEVLSAAGEDASLLTALFYGTVERRLTLDYAISVFAERACEGLSLHTKNALRLGLYQLYFMRTPAHAAVGETVSLGKNAGERGLINAVLRRASVSSLPLPPASRKARYLSVRESFPLSTVRHFISLYGEEETEALLCAFNHVAPLTVTVNTARITRDDLLGHFVRKGIAACPARYCARSIRLAQSISPERLPGFSEGLFFVQDEASALVADALSPSPGDTVLDVCAAPGGKILGTAAKMGGEGTFYAYDLHESKLSLIRESAARLGLPVMVAACDGTKGDPSLDGKVDALLCDVPCSGLGVLGKKPDLRYRERDTSLAALGQAILERSANYVRPGGVLLYSTCTLDPQENEENVRTFLSRHAEYSPEKFVLADGALPSEGGMLTLLPHKHGTDGFFMARLRRAKL